MKLEYGVWWQMRARCTDPTHEAYANYGGRGITVCKRWATFDKFYADVGPRPSKTHTLERKNNNKGYSPKNVKWATRTEQARNRRSNVYVTHDGQKRTFAEWGEITGLGGKLIWQRIDLGWTVERAITTPAASKPKNIAITANGKTLTANEWEVLHGVPAYQIHRRIQNGWTPERAVKTPLG